MNRLLCKIVSALVGAIVAGAIAIGSMVFLMEFQGIDLIVIIAGVIVGAVVSHLLYERLCTKNA